MPRDKRERWGRLAVHRRSYKGPDGTSTAELELRVLTLPARGFTQRRLGSGPREEQYARPSAVMDLGEAVQTAVDAGLPVLLSTEAAGQLKGTVRVGRMKGRPGMLTITTSDGVSATTRRLVAEQALGELRALKRARAKVTLAAGARQVARMTLARPLADDPVLLGRQREMAALKVVGSGVDASAVGTGKTISSGRALAHRATTQPRFRGLVVAEGRLLGQWREELALGAPGRALPPLAPNLELLVLSDDRQIAGQIRRFDRELGDRPGVALVPNSVLDRYLADLQAIPWHLLIADEALRYANPATEAHQALAQLRFGSVADCWLLTANPARYERRAPRCARRPGGWGPGDDHRAAQHPGGRRSDGRDQRPPAAGQLRPAPRTRHAPRHAGMDARGPAGAAARARSRPGVVRAARCDPPGGPGGLPAAARGPAGAQIARGGQRAVQAGARRARPRPRSRARQRRRVRRRERRPRDAHPLQGRARDRARPRGTRRRRDPWRRRRAAAAARHHRPDAGRRRRGGAGDRVRRTGMVPAPARAHATRAARSRGTRRRRQHHDARVRDAQARFTAGEFPVLCLSRIGHEGHNLQNASVLCHLDLPWLPSGLEQRVGRAARPGAARPQVQTDIPYIRRGGIEHVVSVLAARGAEHHQILDSFEGVHAAESTVATQLSEITGQVADSKDDAGYAATAARLRVAASVFGN